MDNNGNLILTGWGYAEYVASAAVALKALGGRADVCGVSRRRLPELLGELAAERGAPRWSHIYILGVSVSGDPNALAEALAKLKTKKVSTTWISALEMPDDIAEQLTGLVEIKVFDSSLLEAVGQSFGVDVEPYLPFHKEPKRVSADVRAYFELIAAAQFYYRNYQDEALYATAASYLANGVKIIHECLHFLEFGELPEDSPPYASHLCGAEHGMEQPQGQDVRGWPCK